MPLLPATAALKRLAVVAVHGEERGAGRGRAARRPLHRVADVEQLHVEEHLLALPGKLARQLEPPGHHQLEADLVEGRRRSETRDQCARVGNARHVERNDQAVSCAKVRQGRAQLL